MYFKNISDEELRQFHPVNTQDFIMSLTDVLDSNLFKIILYQDQVFLISA